MQRAAQELELIIEKPAAGGRMIAHHQGRVVLVAGAIPGERVRARIEREQPGLIRALVTDVIEPDPDRRPVEGDASCGGRTYAHIAYERQLRLKGEIVGDALVRIGKIAAPAPIPVASSPTRGYRMRARFQARGGRLGFFREATHTLCNAAATGQLLPETGRLIDAISHEIAHLGDRVCGVDLAENIAGTERALHLDLVDGATVRPSDLSGLARLAEIGGFTAGSGRAPHLLEGRPLVADPLAAFLPALPGWRDMPLRRHAASFFQGNRYLVPEMVQRVAEKIPDGSVVDLYAGVGLFAVSLAGAGRDPVTAVENHPMNAADLVANAGPFGSRLDVRRTSVEAFLSNPPAAPRTAVVDPPRSGLSREAAAAVAHWGAPLIVYISCDPATLARDVRHLRESGYVLQSVEGFDLFPETPHVEVVAVLAPEN